jgi:hypothetical protein
MLNKQAALDLSQAARHTELLFGLESGGKTPGTTVTRSKSGSKKPQATVTSSAGS